MRPRPCCKLAWRNNARWEWMFINLLGKGCWQESMTSARRLVWKVWKVAPESCNFLRRVCVLRTAKWATPFSEFDAMVKFWKGTAESKAWNYDAPPSRLETIPGLPMMCEKRKWKFRLMEKIIKCRFRSNPVQNISPFTHMSSQHLRSAFNSRPFITLSEFQMKTRNFNAS